MRLFPVPRLIRHKLTAFVVLTTLAALLVSGAAMVGSAYIFGEYDPYSRLFRYAGIFVPVAAAALLLAVALSMWLQSVIARPILSIADVARQVAATGDYSRRVTTSSRDEVGTLVVAFNELLDQIQQRDEALRKKEARTRTILESALHGLVVMDRNGRVRELNLAAEQTFGYSRDDVIGKEMAPLIIPPADRDRHREGLKRYLDTGEGRMLGRRIEVTARRANGEQFPVEIAITRIDTEDGPLFAALIADITGRKRAEQELRVLNVELEQRIRDTTAQLDLANSELESFCYSVSHDLRAPLRAIDGFSEALVEDLPDDLPEQTARYLDRIRSGSQRMGQLIDDLLNLSKVSRGEMNPTEVDMGVMTAEIVESLRRHEPDREVDVSIQGNMTVTGDARLLRIVLENLVGNAWKFTRHAEAPRIEVASMHVDDRPVYFVRDNGVGFDSKYGDKLFGPFQRLHRMEEYPGTGIGLATVQRIVHRHGGKVWAEAAPGKGAVFYFSLTPASDVADPGIPGPPGGIHVNHDDRVHGSG